MRPKSIALDQNCSHGTRARAPVRKGILVWRLNLGGDVISAALRSLELRLAWIGLEELSLFRTIVRQISKTRREKAARNALCVVPVQDTSW